MESSRPKQDFGQTEAFVDQKEETATIELRGEEIIELLEQNELDAIRTVSGIGRGVLIGLALWAAIIVGLIILF